MPAGWFRDILIFFFNFSSPEIFPHQKKILFAQNHLKQRKNLFQGWSKLEEGGGPEWRAEHRALEYNKIFQIDYFLKKKKFLRRNIRRPKI